MKGYRKYFGKKILWFVITFIVAVFLNFFLPRLMPADPVAAITGKLMSGISDASAVQEVYERYAEEFGTNKPLWEQFIIFCQKAIKGDFGLFYSVPRDSGVLYPVTNVIDTYIFRALKDEVNYGMSSAAAFYQSIVGFILLMTSNAIVRKVSPDYALF